ncbi:MAG: hypothetical protein QF687_03970 [Nitrospinaceae bacterium]|nr:hypothetical protein [Nitrospinaceae bacterium]
MKLQSCQGSLGFIAAQPFHHPGRKDQPKQQKTEQPENKIRWRWFRIYIRTQFSRCEKNRQKPNLKQERIPLERERHLVHI